MSKPLALAGRHLLDVCDITPISIRAWQIFRHSVNRVPMRFIFWFRYINNSDVTRRWCARHCGEETCEHLWNPITQILWACSFLHRSTAAVAKELQDHIPSSRNKHQKQVYWMSEKHDWDFPKLFPVSFCVILRGMSTGWLLLWDVCTSNVRKGLLGRAHLVL